MLSEHCKNSLLPHSKPNLSSPINYHITQLLSTPTNISINSNSENQSAIIFSLSKNLSHQSLSKSPQIARIMPIERSPGIPRTLLPLQLIQLSIKSILHASIGHAQLIRSMAIISDEVWLGFDSRDRAGSLQGLDLSQD